MKIRIDMERQRMKKKVIKLAMILRNREKSSTNKMYKRICWMLVLWRGHLIGDTNQGRVNNK
jgi:hypothetical protein